MAEYQIRIAAMQDFEQMRKIYAPYVKNTTITFEYEIPEPIEFKNRMLAIKQSYPVLVLIKNDQVIGYAYAHALNEKAAYQWDAECTIYMDERFLACGMGKVLYTALFNCLKRQNIHTVYACITSENTNSIRFHKKWDSHNAHFLALRAISSINGWMYIGWIKSYAHAVKIPNRLFRLPDVI